MKKILKIFILCLVLFLFSCSSKSESKNDSDAISDADIDSQDSETIKDDTNSEEDSDFIDDSDADDIETDDSDSDTDEPIDVDYQGAEDCPKLSEAKFPYYNDDKSIHFCRKCDTPTVKDPQCMENLWKEAAAKLYALSPESECKDGYPCEMPGIKPLTQAEWDEKVSERPLPYRPHECDVAFNNGVWTPDGSAGSFKHFNMSDGRAGIGLSNLSRNLEGYNTPRSKVMIYDPVEKKYTAIVPILADMLAYHKGCFLNMGKDYRITENTNKYLFYSCEDGSRKVVYPKKIYWLSYTPALNEKWTLANIAETEDEGSVTMYAKVGEWKWTKILDGLSYGPQIVNDKAVFYDDYFKAYYCDLSKNPKNIDECILVNETETEEIRTPIINEDDETEIIYESDVSGKMSMKRLQIGADGKKYKSSMILDTHISSDETWRPAGYALSKVTEDIIFYNETMNDGNNIDCNACFYNRKTKKTSCMKKVEGMEKYYFGYDDWEGKWLLYQFRATSTQAVRDLDCYCEKEGVCPFEE